MLKSAEIGASGPNNKETGDAKKSNLELIDEAIDRKMRKLRKKFVKTVNIILAGTSVAGVGWFAHDQLKNKSDDNREPKILEVKADEGTDVHEQANLYGESDPYEITIGSEARNEFGLGEYTSNETLNSVLNQTGKQFDLPGLYNYKKDEKITPNAVANPEEIYKYMGVADPENPTIEESIDALKYTSYGEGFVSSGIATIFAGADKAPEGFTNDYNKNQDYVYSMEKGGEERLAHEEWLQYVFENSSFKQTQAPFSSLHIYGDETRTGANGEVYGVMTNGDSKTRNVIEQTFTDPEDGTQITWEWQAECFNMGQTAKITKKDGTVYYVTIPEKPGAPTTTTNTPPKPGTDPTPGPKPTPSIEKKNRSNASRINQQNYTDAANEYNTGQITIEESAPQTPADAYYYVPEANQGTEPQYYVNEQAGPAMEVSGQISESNDISNNNGPAAYEVFNPVESNQPAQDVANAGERNEGNTIHDSDAGSMSVDDLLNAE